MTPRDLDLLPISEIPTSSIDLGKRRRTAAGDVRALAESIRKHGLIHPILVSETKDGFRLIAGERRYWAVKQLGGTSIAARVLALEEGDLFRALELAENQDRKPLDAYESSLKRLEEIRAELAGGETGAAAASPPSGTSVAGDGGSGDAGPSSPVGGVPSGDSGDRAKSKPKRTPSIRALSAAAGVPRQTVQRLTEHVSAGERHPVLRDPHWKTRTAIEAGEILDEIARDARDGIYALVRYLIDAAKEEGATQPIVALRRVRAMPQERRQALSGLWLSGEEEQRCAVLTEIASPAPGPDPRVAEIEAALSALKRAASLADDQFTPELREIAKDLRRRCLPLLASLKGEIPSGDSNRAAS